MLHASEDRPEIGGTPGEQRFEQDSSVSLAQRAVGEGAVEFVEGAVTEEELQEGQVRKGRVAALFDRGLQSSTLLSRPRSSSRRMPPP
jgi:hypothetical protein